MTTRNQDPDPPRDPAVDAAWREMSIDAPAAALDAAILAAAHREVSARPHEIDDYALAEAREPARWWWPLAAAATIGAIAFGVLQLVPDQPATTPLHASDIPPQSERKAESKDTLTQRDRGTEAAIAGALPAQPAPAPASAPAATVATAPPEAAARPERPQASAPVPSGRLAARPPATEAGRALPTDSARPPPSVPGPVPSAVTQAPSAADSAPSPLVPAPSPFPGAKQQGLTAQQAPTNALPPAEPAPAAESGGAVARQRAPGSVDMPAVAAGTPAGRAADAATPGSSERARAEAAVAAAPPARTPEAWIAAIERALQAGRPEDAARELRGFRAAWPDADARLPAGLRSFAASVPK